MSLVPQKLRLLRWYRGALPPGTASPLQIVMVQATRFCNIDCRYCYLPYRQQKGEFDLARLPLLMRKLDAAGLLGPELTMVWHAGEPLVLDPSYYRRAIALVQEAAPRTRVTHSFQTNAMLVNPEFCELFKEPAVRVGVSIDGPAHVHDLHRQTRGGKGTHALAMRGIELMQERGVRFSTITVLTRDSLAHPDGIFDFLCGLGPTEIGFNVDELEGAHRTSSLGADAQQAYAGFMRRVMELAMKTPQAPRVRELAGAFAAAQGAIFGRRIHSSEANPFSILSVSIDGRISTWSPELLDQTHPRLGGLTFGSIEDIDFPRVYEDPHFSALDSEIRAGVELCAGSCPYFDVCGGGAPSNKLAENGSFASGSTTFCTLRHKTLIDLAETFMRERLSGRAGASAAQQTLARA